MKTRNIIGAAVLILGLILAVCTMDGSNHEILLRGLGVALTAIGAAVGGFFGKEERNV